jgi:hypothetical protein
MFGITPPEASASALGNARCEEGEFCLWDQPNMTGCFKDLGDFYGWDDAFYVNWDTCPETPMNDSITSFLNNSDMVGGFWNETNKKGPGYCAYKRSASPKIHSDWDNKISSFIVAHSNPPNNLGKDANCKVHKRNRG